MVPILGRRAGWVGRLAVTWPHLAGDDDRLVERLLGEVDIAQPTHQCPEDRAGVGAIDPLDGKHRQAVMPDMSTTGRTSMVPVRAPGILAAIAMARSRSAALTT